MLNLNSKSINTEGEINIKLLLQIPYSLKHEIKVNLGISMNSLSLFKNGLCKPNELDVGCVPCYNFWTDTPW